MVFMSVKRVVPVMAIRFMGEAKLFYDQVLGFQPVMDHGWILTLADPYNSNSQISLMTHDETAPAESVNLFEAPFSRIY